MSMKTGRTLPGYWREICRKAEKAGVFSLCSAKGFHPLSPFPSHIALGLELNWGVLPDYFSRNK